MTEPNAVLAAFTELAPHYEDAMGDELTALWGLDYREFVCELLGMGSIGSTDAILDVATGTAFIPRMLQDMAGYQGQVIGLDITPAMLTQAQSRIEDAGQLASTQLVCA